MSGPSTVWLFPVDSRMVVTCGGAWKLQAVPFSAETNSYPPKSLTFSATISTVRLLPGVMLAYPGTRRRMIPLSLTGAVAVTPAGVPPSCIPQRAST
ncbi:hypothetical protein HS121_17675 [bacterium]|nr:hypothetical protein [bacterium]